ncbi:hypothetical protein [Acetatifactor aquisgranensis]|uniref:hypothetical protein n=1 Tax=Acetatifactor aquisgranensis TaxID=2941233 RepID=UPI00203A738F|nr:hypothetical protein [Acetatifactor aquisgranensis]
MDYREEYEQKIDLKDMLFHILYRWRSVLLITVIAGGLTAGYAALYNMTILPGKRDEVQAQLQEQTRILDELRAQAQSQEQGQGQAPGQTAEETQKQIDQLESRLGELKKYSYLKYCAMGLAAGLFGIFFCYVVSYALSDKMRGESEILERYDYRLLGTFPRRRKKKLLSGIDRFLEKKEGVSGQMTEEEAYRIASVNITNLAKDGGAFLVTGTIEFGKLQEFVKAIVPQLQENVVLMVGADMNVTASTLEMLAECDAVILVEERGRSLRARVHKEHESIAALEKAVVGYVAM